MDTPVNHFEHDLLKALSADIKHISPKYFYDAPGSALFDQICDLPEYYPTKTELSILSKNAGAIAEHIGPHAELIELGAGSLTKVRFLLRQLESPTAFLPMDISGDHLKAAAKDLQHEFPQLAVSPIVADYTHDWSLPAEHPETQRRIAFFPGSTIGNFLPAEVDNFFANCAKHLPAGALLLGVDLLKSPQIIHQAYNDAQGITAAFNLNLLTRANHELKTNFDVSQFAHWAFYNAPQHRIEMHLVSLKRQEIQLKNRVFVLEEGETLHTENSYKYSIEKIQTIAAKQGLRPGPVWTDPNHWFGLLWFDIPNFEMTKGKKYEGYLE
jgi:dimethylhistidine N-methyltransferase